MKNIAWCLLLLCQCALGQTSKEEELNTITGNPYLFKEWNDGVVRFTSGRTMNQFKLKFDCLKNSLLLQFQGNAFATESKVQEFVMYPYFHVMVQGKTSLLRLIARNIVEEKQLVSVNGRVDRRLEDVEQYYMLQNGKMILLPANTRDLPDVFADKKEPIARFIATKQLRMHDPEDFVAVVNKYNELLAAQ